MTTSSEPALLLNGLDGSNPLGFLAAIGVLQVVSDSNRTARIRWAFTHDGWRPLLTGCGNSEDELCFALHSSLSEASTAVFDVGRTQHGARESSKFPFAADLLAGAFKAAFVRADAEDRREADLLAAFGMEPHPDKHGVFQCTRFKMVRSGDANSQGMLFYAKALRDGLDRRMLERTLFAVWDHGDVGYSLRWDPIEDRRYALRWRDPSKPGVTDGSGTMIAANCLAVEALRCLPVMPSGVHARTTGFHELHRLTTFVWPIWTATLALETIRSLLSLPDLDRKPLDRSALAARGIEEVYGADLVRPNQYYSNFAPALPVA